jgi:nucleotide-binding universal stress UspA family protein
MEVEEIMSYQRILVPLDGSKFSELALQHVAQIAASGARIHVLSVIADNPVDEVAALASARAYSVPSPEKQWPQVKETDLHDPNARETYVRRVSDWLGGAGYQVTAETVPGNVVETILSVAQRGFDAIVLATHGRTGANKMVLGSVAETLIHEAVCPVLVIPPGAAPK